MPGPERISFSNSPEAERRSYSSGRSCLSCSTAVTAGEDVRLQRELVRDKVVIEEVHREDEESRQQGLFRMDQGRYIDKPAWEDVREFFREPEHKAGKPDGEHPPEYREKVKLFPVGPAVQLRHCAPVEEP